MEVGTVLWRMVGKRQNDEIRWYAEPKCVEYVDEHIYLYGDRCGGSLNNVGVNVFLSREECISHFMEKHDSLIQKIPIDEKSPDDVYDLPRTDWQEWLVTRFDSVECTSVYRNGLNKLVNITNALKWHTEYVEGLEMQVDTLTLKEISEQVESGMITVIQNDPMRCKIFQYGNYLDGKWYKLGEIMGYE